MKKTTLLSLLLASAGISQQASADTLAQWTFETSPPADLLNSTTLSGILADVGSGTASAFHTDAATDWTTPAGNGSANSLSANTWNVGDYFQFMVSSVGYSGLSVTFDQTGSNTGPKDYYLAYSTDGTTFTQFGSTYALINGGWSSGIPVLTTSYSFDLSAITALDNSASVYFRLVDASTTAINLGVVATGGTDRVDNFTVTATPVVVPEPSAMAIVGGFGMLVLVMAARRRN
jgi:hypothetical protein